MYSVWQIHEPMGANLIQTTTDFSVLHCAQCLGIQSLPTLLWGEWQTLSSTCAAHTFRHFRFVCCADVEMVLSNLAESMPPKWVINIFCVGNLVSEIPGKVPGLRVYDLEDNYCVMMSSVWALGTSSAETSPPRSGYRSRLCWRKLYLCWRNVL